MGIYGLWPLIKAKGYEPEVVYPSTRAKHLPNATSAVHVDLQACMFVVLRQAYSNHPLTVADGILEARLSQLVPKTNSVVYNDGLRCKEKENTHASRDEDRKTALNETKGKIKAFADKDPMRRVDTRPMGSAVDTVFSFFFSAMRYSCLCSTMLLFRWGETFF